jgi:L-2-hydroxyglutarate oxidase LhgO
LELIHSVVVGAGVIGLAVARALAQSGREVLVLEAAGAIGSETSSRNSEVVHAGIYYPAGSLKAKLCVQGREQLYRFAEEYGVAALRCGKLIVATNEGQHVALRALQTAGQANGVHDLQWLSAAEAKAMEPALRCTAALWSPSTGIVDSHGLMLALQGDAEARGAVIAFRSPLLGGRATAAGIELEVDGEQPMRLLASELVNAAGLRAPELGAAIEGQASKPPAARYCKGSYFSLGGRAPFSRLVYPMHDHAGLGVHLTLDLAGQARFGPDTEWVDHIDYSVDPARADAFYSAIRRYWPALPDGALQPAYAGIRPKIVGPGEPAADFRIDGPAAHGVPGLVQLYGIESPGLTASLAIANHVLELLDK